MRPGDNLCHLSLKHQCQRPQCARTRLEHLPRHSAHGSGHNLHRIPTRIGVLRRYDHVCPLLQQYLGRSVRNRCRCQHPLRVALGICHAGIQILRHDRCDVLRLLRPHLRGLHVLGLLSHHAAPLVARYAVLPLRILFLGIRRQRHSQRRRFEHRPRGVNLHARRQTRKNHSCHSVFPHSRHPPFHHAARRLRRGFGFLHQKAQNRHLHLDSIHSLLAPIR